VFVILELREIVERRVVYNQSISADTVSLVGSLGQNETHENFRDSKLTSILQPSLSGNARVAIICCATPSDLYLKETRSTLQFASCAKLVKTRAQVNEVMDDRSLIAGAVKFSLIELL
jgi:hypothetical protein